MEVDIIKLKKEIIEILNLEELTPEDIDENAPLFGVEGMGLDSIDVLELIVLMRNNYDINITDPNQGEKIFSSVNTMAEYIRKMKSEQL